MDSNQAAGVFIHFFKLVFEKAGLEFDADCESEVRDAVRALIASAVRAAAAEIHFSDGQGLR